MVSRTRALQERLLPSGPLDALRQVLLFFIAYYGYRLVRGAIDDPAGASVAFQNARNVIHLEQGLGLFVEPSIQAWAATKPAVIDFASWTYLNCQSSVTLGALVFLYLFHNRSFYFVRNMFVVAMGVALIGYVLVPTAPPRFFPEWGFFDAVANFTGVSHDSVAVNTLFNPYAAIPSMHVAFALMIGVPLARLSKRRVVKVAWALYPLLVTFVIVATGNHFLIDAFLGALTAALAAWAAAWLARARPASWSFNEPSTSAA
jgi:membrane-associated phospholipid phosphatase